MKYSKYVIQGCIYARIFEEAQSREPRKHQRKLQNGASLCVNWTSKLVGEEKGIKDQENKI